MPPSRDPACGVSGGPGFILEGVRCKRGLAQHLGRRDREKFRFYLPVKVRRVVENFFQGVVNQITQEREVGSLLLLLAEIAFFHGQASALRARPASLEDNFRNHNNPNIDSALFVLIVLVDPADIHLNDFADRLVVIDDTGRGINGFFVDGTRDELAFIEGDTECFLNSRKVGEMQPDFLLHLSRGRNLDAFLDLRCPDPKISDPISCADNADTNVLCFLRLIVWAI